MMMEILKELWRDESGASAVEYALIAGLMASFIVLALSQSQFSTKLQNFFTNVANKIETAGNIVDTGQSQQR